MARFVRYTPKEKFDLRLVFMQMENKLQSVVDPTWNFLIFCNWTIYMLFPKFPGILKIFLFLAGVREIKGTLNGMYLVIAGGYDERVEENRQHHLELSKLAAHLDLGDSVIFLRSITSQMKTALLKHSTCILYTPDREHFGIVPIEAMYSKCPVIAVNSGGPKETVVNGVTGFLCSPIASAFTEAMVRFVDSPGLAKELGEAGHERVVQHFSFNAYSEKLNSIVLSLMSG